MVAGDTCLIRKGIYREKVEPANSGTSTKPILYRAFENDVVVISATARIESWQQYSGSIYRASNVTMPLGNQNMLYYDSTAQQLARWPNDLDGDPYTFDGYKILTTSGTYSDSYITHPDIPDYWTDGVIHWLGAHSGCAIQRSITGFDPAEKRLFFKPFPDYWPFGTHSPTRFENGHRGTFFLLNKLEALDAPGEWFYDASQQSLYFYAPGAVDPSSGVAEVAVRNRTLTCSRNHVHFENLNFFGAPVELQGSNCRLIASRVRHCVAGLITDSDSATAGGAAVLVIGDDVWIKDCLVEEGSATGINIASGAARAVVENCVIRNFDTQGNHCSPLRSSGPGARILRNRIHGSARDVSRVGGSDSEFGYNDVFDGLLACADGGLFYVTGNSVPRNIELHHNWFHDAYSPDYAGDKATGIYLDNNSAGYIVHHNVVWDVKWGGLHFNWTAIENEIYNNTFWNVGDGYATILSWIPERDGVQTDVRDNILYNNLSDVREWWDSGAGSMTEDETLDNDFAHNVQVLESPFISIARKNFMLAEAQPDLVDQGVVVPGITDNALGAAPDIGAYEFGGQRWIPGPDWTLPEISWTTLEVLDPATYSQWIQGFYPLSSPEADRWNDPDLDGQSNFLEYVTGGNPANPADPGVRPSLFKAGPSLFLAYSARLGAEDLETRIESSPNLAAGSWTEANLIAVETRDLQGGLREVILGPVDLSGDNFFRLTFEESGD